MASLATVLGGSFDATAVAPQQPLSNEPLPAGTYEVEITNAELRDLKSGNGVGLNVEYTVISPEQYARRKCWQNLNIRHTNPQAEQIGQSQLSALCAALGIPKLDDSDQLFQRIVRIGVKVRPASGNYGPSNDVTGYEAVGTRAAPRQAAPTPAAAAPAPWKRKAA